MEEFQPNILKFITAQERNKENRELWIVTEYHQLGSLTGYLKNNILKENDMLKVLSTMAAGLS